MVLEGYPLSFDIDWLLQHSNVETATRMKVRFSKEKTRQILISYLGEPPEYLLTTTGTFTLRKYYPEPLRCTKCQRFGHLTKCRFRPCCGVCSELHLTEICLQNIRDGKKPTAKCPNCSQGHHAWNLKCPERKKRLNIPPDLRQDNQIITPRLFPRKLHSWNKDASPNPSTPRASSTAPVSSLTRGILPSTGPVPVLCPPLSPRPCTNCGHHQDSTAQDATLILQLLQTCLTLLGREVNPTLLQNTVSNVITTFPNKNVVPKPHASPTCEFSHWELQTWWIPLLTSL